MSQPPKRPKNREIEDEMICPPEEEGQPPRPVTEPKTRDKKPDPQRKKSD